MKILFLQTGGTIDKAYPMGENNHGYNFLISTPAYDRILKRANPSFDFVTKQVLQKDSTDISDEDRRIIYEICKESPETKIIITHGTDTMMQTAKVLSELTNKTIVITGALTPELFRDSDADFNLGVAVGAVSTLEAGVFIAMNGRVMKWNETMFDTEASQFKSTARE